MRSPALHHRTASLILCASFAAALLVGCSEDPTAVAPTEYPYTLYGILNPASDTQKVRVFPIESRLLPNNPEPLDATVTSTDLQTGEVVVWRDSILAFENGTYGYLFWSPFRPEGGHTYRLDVTRSDQAQSRVTATVPQVPLLHDPIMSPQVTIPATIGGNGSQVHALVIRYAVSYGWQPNQKDTLTFRYAGRLQPSSDVYRFDLTLSTDYAAIYDSLRSRGRCRADYGVLPLSVEMEALVTDAAWRPPGGVFDPEILIEPGVFNNVENGFGFLGSGYFVKEQLAFTDETWEAAGFTPDEIPAPWPPIPPPPCL